MNIPIHTTQRPSIVKEVSSYTYILEYLDLKLVNIHLKQVLIYFITNVNISI